MVNGTTTVNNTRLHRLEIVFIACKYENYLHELSSRDDESINKVELSPGNSWRKDWLCSALLFEIIAGADLKL